jgi:hypothetical protein
VLEDAIVDFVFVAIMHVVARVKMFRLFRTLKCFFLIFSLLTRVPHPIVLPVLSRKKMKLPERNSWTAKERKNPREMMPYIVSPV